MMLTSLNPYYIVLAREGHSCTTFSIVYHLFATLIVLWTQYNIPDYGHYGIILGVESEGSANLVDRARRSNLVQALSI